MIIKIKGACPLKFSTCLHSLSAMLKGKRREFCCAFREEGVNERCHIRLTKRQYFFKDKEQENYRH